MHVHIHIHVNPELKDIHGIVYVCVYVHMQLYTYMYLNGRCDSYLLEVEIGGGSGLLQDARLDPSLGVETFTLDKS